MKVRMTATGTRPLLMHNVRLASPLDLYAKKLKAMTAKRNKTDEDRLEIAHLEWEGGLYFDPEIGPYVPAAWVFACLVEGGRLTKSGKKIERGVAIEELQMPLVYKGPRSLEKMWGDGTTEFVDMRTAKVGTAKIDRCRPVFRDWAFEADLIIDPTVLDVEEFTDVARNAGALVGIGDYRRLYGRFSTTVEPL